MKYGRVLRGARIVLAIVIVAMFIVPLAISLVNTDAEKMSAGIESRYDLEAINEDPDIGVNIIRVNLQQIDNLGNVFYVSIDDGYSTYDEGSLEERIDSAAIDIHKAVVNRNKIAVVYDSDYKVCMQKSIQYHDGITTKVVTGMKVPDKIGGMASVDISMRLVGKDVDYDIPFGSSKTDNGYILITTDIPDLLLMLSNAIDHDLSLKVHLVINEIAGFDIDIDIMTKAVEPIATSPYLITFSRAAIGSMSVDVGTDVRYYYDGPNVILKVINGEQTLSKSIIPESDGRLKLDYYPAPDVKMTGYIDSEYVDDIIKMVEYLEVKNIEELH